MHGLPPIEIESVGAPTNGVAELAQACEAWKECANASHLTRWLARELDDDGSPKRLAPENWGPCLDLLFAAADRRPGWPESISGRVEGLFAWLVHLSRPDGSLAFGAAGRDSSRAARLRAGARRHSEPGWAAVAARWFPGSKLGRGSTAPPLPAVSQAGRVLAMLRPDWNDDGDWLAIDHRAAGDVARIDLQGGPTWLQGLWSSLEPAPKIGPAAPTHWTTGAYADALEWTFRAGPTRITRTAVMLRYRQVALLAQQEDGPAAASGFRIDLPKATTAAPAADLRAWVLGRLKKRARLVPIGLPASPYPTDRGSLDVADGSAVLRMVSEGRRRWLPMLATWGDPPTHWRTLTVTERSKICRPDVAFAARVSWGVGRDGLLIYRSLGKPALRVFLGHQTKARFLVARFTPEGDVAPLVSID